MILDLDVHKSHSPLWKDKSWRYAFLEGGRGNGRSGTASRFALSELYGEEYTRGAMMRAVHADIRTSCWGELMNRINEKEIQEDFHIVDNDMFIERGMNSLRGHGFKSSSGSLTARLKSLAEYNFVWIEEAEEIGEEEFTKLDDTLRTTKGRIRIVFTFNTPPKNHWIHRRWFDLIPHPEVKGFYIPKLKEGIKDAIFIPGTFRENINNLDKNTVERYLSYQYSNPAYYWQVIEGLSPEEVRGKIFSGWQQIDAVPPGAKLVKFGLDWGWFPDPISVVAIYYFNGSYYVDEVIHGTQIEDEAIANAIKSVPDWENVPVICGADEPKSIETLNKYRIRAEKTDNRAGSVNYRIKVTSTKKIFVTKRSDNVWKGYEVYHWAEDKDGNPRGIPDHQGSDPMDAVSYAIASINPMQNYLNPPINRKTVERKNPAR